MAKMQMSLFTRLRRTRVYYPGMNKALPKRINWEREEKIPRQEGRKVVKGTTRKIIVVKSPDPKIFEQAIFIVKDEAGASEAGRTTDVLREAEKVANDYIKGALGHPTNLLSKAKPAFFALAGAAAAGVVMFALKLVGIQ